MSDNFFTNPMFEQLSPLKKAVITELVEKAGNASLEAAFPLLLKANATLKKNGEDFSSAERTFLITELTNRLSPEERKKVAALLKLL